MAIPFISKSTFIQGLQCQKLLWYRYNAKDQIPAPGEQQQAIFDQGKEVGNLAKQLFPGGIEIECDHSDYDQLIAETKKHLVKRNPLFEASFQHNGGFARVDILDPVGKDEWDIIEVKSSTQVKDVHLQDIAFQAYVLDGAGLKIRRCFLLLINNDYIRKGAIKPKELFTRAEVTSEVSGLSREVESHLEEMQRTIGLSKHPAIKIGPYCSDPYPCPLHDVCWGFLPENNVFALYRGGKKPFQLLDQGIQALAAIPENYPLTENQAIQRRTVLTGRPHIDEAAIATFLSQLKYPLSFLDFETIGTAIPLFDDSSPYQQIPFQFSMHIVGKEGAKPEHHGFLTDGRDDPRPEFMKRLRQALPDTGSIIVFNASFEKNVLKDCCEIHTGYSSWLKKLEPRIVDLLLPFRGFKYYHPKQEGSASMKAALPALTGKGYEGLAIQEGGMASLEFLRVTFAEVPAEERSKVRKQLEEYCGLDTRGMVQIVERLGEFSRK